MENNKIQETKEDYKPTEQEQLQQQIYVNLLRMQEIDATIEKYDYFNEDMVEEENVDEILQELKEEYKILKSETKVLKKKTQVGLFDKIPIWVYIYGLVFTILGLAPVMKKFTELLAPTAINILGDFLYTWFGTFLYLYTPTILLLGVSVVIFIIVFKKELLRKIMYIILGIHTLNAIITIVSLIDIFKRLRG
ncbi:MAG: hypothetical protein PHU02_00045 [Bacilli bacterium]|nr:hypothetical protein [Bacilli bacterium]MDD4481685.1 hypothetical protein [Bacilli bacterium]MDD5182542.1 hypothetical protein [Bacilli bacterium]